MAAAASVAALARNLFQFPPEIHTESGRMKYKQKIQRENPEILFKDCSQIVIAAEKVSLLTCSFIQSMHQYGIQLSANIINMLQKGEFAKDIRYIHLRIVMKAQLTVLLQLISEWHRNGATR